MLTYKYRLRKIGKHWCWYDASTHTIYCYAEKQLNWLIKNAGGFGFKRMRGNAAASINVKNQYTFYKYPKRSGDRIQPRWTRILSQYRSVL